MSVPGTAGSAPFRRVLVANRGEIALRIIRACRELGMESVAVYSDADAGAPHVRAADAALRIGPPPATESYLRIDAIIDAARRSGAEAIHPGYGFLSERAAFAEACAAAGIVFVGPEARTLAGLGDKLSARRAAAASNVPVVPGTLEPVAIDSSDALAAISQEAERIGWPLLVKASAGGGGRGMRMVEHAADLQPSLLAASREAAAAFGDGAVYLERFVTGARHVEVQLLGDAAGTIVALGERDCSVQRRHQKLVEEAPAPGLSTQQRRRLHSLGVTIAGAFGLRNAATAEFLFSPEGDFWFLEVNTRLQVEHGVTELITGLDLVQEQFWIAAGRPLSPRVLEAAQAAAAPVGHAIEVRLSAEDPGRGFAPVSGRLTRWRGSAGPGVRVDSGVEEGMEVTPNYDPLLAKLLVHAGDRAGALARLRRALAEFDIGGLQTTLAFDRWLVDTPEFQAARLSTEFVDQLWHPEVLVETAARQAAELAAAADAFGLDAEHHTRSGAATLARTIPGSQPGARRPDGADGWLRAGRREATGGWSR